eukprot:2386302-Pyramimonas_sp.AAC.1
MKGARILPARPAQVESLTNQLHRATADRDSFQMMASNLGSQLHRERMERGAAINAQAESDSAAQMSAQEDWMEPTAGPTDPAPNSLGPEAWKDLPALRELGLAGGWLVSPVGALWHCHTVIYRPKSFT